MSEGYNNFSNPKTTINILSIGASVANVALLSISTAGFLEDKSLSAVFGFIALFVLVGKLFVNWQLWKNGERDDGNMRHALGIVLLTMASLLLGFNDKNDYFNDIRAVFLLAVFDRLCNLALSVDLTDGLGGFVRIPTEKLPSEYVWALLVLLLVATGLVTGSFLGNTHTEEGTETVGHYKGGSTESVVALVGIGVAAAHLILIGFMLLMDSSDTWVPLNRMPAFRSVAAGSHLSLVAIHCGHLLSSEFNAILPLIAGFLLILVDFVGRNDGKSVA